MPDSTAAPADTLQRDTLRSDTLRSDSLRSDTTVADTVRTDTTAADTTAAAEAPGRERLSEVEVVSFDAPLPGRAVTGRLPARTPVLDATGLLTRVPGAFRYDFGAVGWPNGISFRGRPPDQAALTLDGRSFDDPLTGRPRYDLLPLAFLRPLRTASAAGLGTPEAVHARLRPFDSGRPLTELRYQRGGGNLQGIAAVHAQRRRLRLFGTPFFLSFVGGYIGRAADNFLPGSDLRRERRLLGRVQVRRPRFALRLSALHNRRRLGAQGGVALPEDLPLGSIYAGDVQVRHRRAERRLLRTDLAATLRLRLGLGAPLTASAYWTPQTFRYRNPGATDSLAVDTLAAETDRYGLRLAQRFALRTEHFGRHRLRLQAHAWTDRRSSGNALPDGAGRSRLHLTVRDSTRLLGSAATFEAGLHAGDVQTYPSAMARLEHASGAGGGLRFFGEARLAGQPVAWIEEEGFGPLVQALPEGQTPGPVFSSEVGVRAQTGLVETRLAVFFERTYDRLDLYATAEPDTARARVSEGVFQRTGASLSARWRADEERGFYATASATAFLDDKDRIFFNRVAPTAPGAFGHGRLGARYELFTGDLDLDAYVEGRFWTQMKSRTLHAPTGRLVVPRAGSRSLGPTGVIDAHIEAGIRDATLFFSYENALSGTQVQPGALTVPLYPLPEQRFRFGVYWPIFG